MMRHWSVYDAKTGLFTGRQFASSTPEHERLFKVPAGCALREGRFDYQSQRVDVLTAQVVDYQPPQPDDDHEWRENVENGRPRWVKRSEVVQRESEDAGARAAIQAIEASQARTVREALLGDAAAIERLRGFEQQIAAERAKLQRPAPSRRTSGAVPTAPVEPPSE